MIIFELTTEMAIPKGFSSTSGHTPWGFQCNLQAQFSLARVVTGDRFVFTSSPTSHTAAR